MDELNFECSGRVDLRNALAVINRQKPTRARIRWTHSKRKNADDLPVISVPEGTVLLVHVISGIPFLTMASGRVVFHANSSWGNSMTVRGGQLHVLTYDQKRKVTIRVEGQKGTCTVTTSAAEVKTGNRLYMSGLGRGELPEVVETDLLDEPVEWGSNKIEECKVISSWVRGAVEAAWHMEYDMPDADNTPPPGTIARLAERTTRAIDRIIDDTTREGHPLPEPSRPF